MGDEITVEGEDARHLAQVVRMRPGERLRVSRILPGGAEGDSFLCELIGCGEDLYQTPGFGEGSLHRAGQRDCSLSGNSQGGPDGNRHREGGRTWRPGDCAGGDETLCGKTGREKEKIPRPQISDHR